MKRLYFSALLDHYALYRQMIFITGPRQVGKTTLSKILSQTQAFTVYRNWDFEGDQLLILQGTQALLEKKDLLIARDRNPILILDEIHKFKNWREFLKGLYDTYSDNLMMVVTGSSQLDLFRCAGDSLMGRYLLYKIHPLSGFRMCA